MGGIEEDGQPYTSDEEQGAGGVLQLGRRDLLKALGGIGGAAAASQYETISTVLPYVTGRTHTDCGPFSGLDDTDNADDGWTVAVLPDTQHYARSDNLLPYATAQTEWIANNADEENIVFATHEGDLVHDGSDTQQWDRIDDALATLDGEVPYSVVAGNHDWAETGDKTSDISQYRERFGAERFADYGWYGGSGPDEASHYQTFSAGDYEFLHLGLEWRPRDETLDWAQDVIDAHAGMPTIVTTHGYLEDDTFSPGRIDTEDAGDRNGHDGEYLFNNFISPNDQIFMVCCGHIFRGWPLYDQGEYRNVATNDAGQPVYELLANFQGRPNGGNGWLRTITFTPGGGSCSAAPDSIDVLTYSPARNDYQTSRASDFNFELDFDERFDAA